ncbi:MAG: phage major capsid protein [Reyranella sp.]|nr:phage major capsid protein [Reyranella sp.]
MKLHELQEARTAAVVAMRALADMAEVEKRDLSADEDKKFGDLKSEITGYDKKIERARTLADAERSAPAIVHGRLGDGAYEERARDFSITKAIIAAMPRDLGGGNVDAGFECEISTEVARRSGRKFEGIAVPDQVFHAERRAFGNNVMLTSGNAASLVPTNLLANQFIDRLRSSLVVGRLGATVLDGLVGDNDIPKQIGSATAEWVGEDGSLSDTDLDFDDVQLRPKTVGAITSYSRRTLLNTTPAIEGIVRNDLAAIVANAIDKAALVGLGASNQPAGIVEQGDVHEIDMTEPLYEIWEKILSFPANIQHSDAEIGSLAWVMNAWAAKKLRSTSKVTDDSVTGWVMENANSLAGYPAAITSALPGNPTGPVAGTMIFGDFSQLLVGYWSGTDLLLNPYESTAYQKGRVLVRAMRDCDVAVRHGEAFAFTDNFVV